VALNDHERRLLDEFIKKEVVLWQPWWQTRQSICMGIADQDVEDENLNEVDDESFRPLFVKKYN
jgi:hypothetical protein